MKPRNARECTIFDEGLSEQVRTGHKGIYLDHAATTPVDPIVAQAMVTCMERGYGNPSSLHAFGREARHAMQVGREQVAALIGAAFEEIVFTSGGTEADNLGLNGVALDRIERGDHLIVSRIEHHAVLETAKALEGQGFRVTYLPVDGDGLVDPDDVRRAITPRTVLISVMLANNEVGSIQDVAAIGKIARERGVTFHSDAVQAAGSIQVDVNELNVDLLSISAHKLYGPKGIGALYVRKGTGLRPMLHGGGQERGRRAGTENLPGIVGFGVAAQLAKGRRKERAARAASLRDRLVAGVLAQIPHARLNGHANLRLPGNAHFSFLGIEGEVILLNLDLEGIACSSGSACASGTPEPSHVLTAMGVPGDWAGGSVRLTLGEANVDGDVDRVLEVLAEVVAKLRRLSPVYVD